MQEIHGACAKAEQTRRRLSTDPKTSSDALHATDTLLSYTTVFG